LPGARIGSPPAGRQHGPDAWPESLAGDLLGPDAAQGEDPSSDGLLAAGSVFIVEACRNSQ
jgi:hypothetical protein